MISLSQTNRKKEFRNHLPVYRRSSIASEFDKIIFSCLDNKIIKSMIWVSHSKLERDHPYITSSYFWPFNTPPTSVRPKFGIGWKYRPKLKGISIGGEFFFSKTETFFLFFSKIFKFFHVFLLPRGILVFKNLKLNTNLQKLPKNLENLAANLV